MKRVVLDTNFILTCVKQKIDFFEELKFKGLQILIPLEVTAEIERLSNSKNKKLSDQCKIALQIMEKNRFEIIQLEGKTVDKGIINFAEKNKDAIIATLDNEMKSKISNKKLIIRNQKKLEI